MYAVTYCGKIAVGAHLNRWHDSPMRRARPFLGWRFRLTTILVAYTTFFGTALISDLVSSPNAPAFVAKVSIPADALVAAVATVFMFAVVELTSNMKSG